MQSTTNYNLNILEGTDLVNPPIQLNPNFQTIDAAMFANKQGSIGTATEVVTGTVHAIVRSNTDSDTFRFTATGAWTAGDTMTLDGSAVTVHLSDGTTPPTGAYIIGAEVLAVVNGSLVTLMIGATPPAQGVTSFNSRTGAVTPQASDYDASMIDYDNTISGLTATDVQSAIDEIANAPSSGFNYSTTEHVVGTWIDGSTLYEKTIHVGQLPSAAGSKSEPHNISNLGKVIYLNGTCDRSSGITIPMPYISNVNITNQMELYTTATDVVVTVKSDQSVWDCYATMRYTKTI